MVVSMQKFRDAEAKSKKVNRKVFLFVEGIVTEKDYFERIIHRCYQDKNLDFQVIPENNIEKIASVLAESDFDEAIDYCYVIQDFDRYCESFYDLKKQEWKTHQKRYIDYNKRYKFIFTSPSFEYNMYVHFFKQKNRRNDFKSSSEIVSELNKITHSNMPLNCKDFKGLLDEHSDFFQDGIERLIECSKGDFTVPDSESLITSFSLDQNFSMLGLLFSELDTFPDVTCERKISK